MNTSTDRLRLTNELAAAQAHLAALHKDQARQTDREGRTRFRVLITSAVELIDDIEAEIAEYDAREGSAERKAQRAVGRQAVVEALRITTDLELWSKLHGQIEAATTTARKLTESGQQAAEHVTTTIAAHSLHQALESTRVALMLPPAAGSDTGTVEALARALKTLIEACPGGDRLTGQYLTPNAWLFSSAAPYRKSPTLLEARRTAVSALHLRLDGLCAEPAPVVITSQVNPIDYAARSRVAA